MRSEETDFWTNSLVTSHSVVILTKPGDPDGTPPVADRTSGGHQGANAVASADGRAK